MAAGQYFGWYPFDQSAINECTHSHPEAASFAAKRGTPVLKDTNGRIDVCGTSPALIYGVTLEDGHNGTAGQYNVLVAEIRAGDAWVIPILEAMALNQQGLAGGDCGIVKDATTGLWYGSTADAGAQCRIFEAEPPPAGMNIGDTKWPGRVKFHSSKLQMVP